MVKGTSRRVIVVNSPDTELFEQAIFIVRRNVAEKKDITAEALVDEACRVARSYSRTHTEKRPLLRPTGLFFWCAALVLAGGLALLVSRLL